MNLTIGGKYVTWEQIKHLLRTDHPMVEEFLFCKDFEDKDKYISFSLHIIPRKGVRYQQQRDAQGKRIEPVWRTLSGKEQIGRGNRVIRHLGNGELVAENSTFFPNQRFNDLGIGSALYVAMERFYRYLGVQRVTLLAVRDGTYVWGRQGFTFKTTWERRSVYDAFRAFVQEQEVIVTTNYQWYPWDYANIRNGKMRDGYHLGKYFMLYEIDNWRGLKELDNEDMNKVAMESRRETFSRLPGKIEGAPACLEVI